MTSIKLKSKPSTLKDKEGRQYFQVIKTTVFNFIRQRPHKQRGFQYGNLFSFSLGLTPHLLISLTPNLP